MFKIAVRIFAPNLYWISGLNSSINNPRHVNDEYTTLGFDDYKKGSTRFNKASRSFRMVFLVPSASNPIITSEIC